MDARALRYFQAVVEFGSYSRASEYLRISQPAISRQVDRLEQELGKTLFVRNGLGATPTDAGRLLFERSQPILRQLEDAAAEIKSASAGTTGTIVIAIPPGVGHFLLAPLVERYRRSVPEHVAEDHLRVTAARSTRRWCAAAPTSPACTGRCRRRVSRSFRCWKRKSSWSASAAPCRHDAIAHCDRRAARPAADPAEPLAHLAPHSRGARLRLRRSPSTP